MTLRVEDFAEQVGVLNARHPRPLSGGDIERLYRLVRGHPFLTRKALYMAAGSARRAPSASCSPMPVMTRDRSAITCGITCCGCSGSRT